MPHRPQLNIDKIAQSQDLGGKHFQWKAYDYKGNVLLHVWTASCGTFAAELGAFKSRLANNDDDIARVHVWLTEDPTRVSWTLHKGGHIQGGLF